MKIKACSIFLLLLPLISYARFSPEAALAAGYGSNSFDVQTNTVCPSSTDLPLTLMNGEKISCFSPSKVSSGPRCVVGEDLQRDFVYDINLSQSNSPVDKLVICKGDDHSSGCAYHSIEPSIRIPYTSAKEPTCSFKFVPPEAERYVHGHLVTSLGMKIKLEMHGRIISNDAQ